MGVIDHMYAHIYIPIVSYDRVTSDILVCMVLTDGQALMLLPIYMLKFSLDIDQYIRRYIVNSELAI